MILINEVEVYAVRRAVVSFESLGGRLMPWCAAYELQCRRSVLNESKEENEQVHSTSQKSSRVTKHLVFSQSLSSNIELKSRSKAERDDKLRLETARKEKVYDSLDKALWECRFVYE